MRQLKERGETNVYIGFPAKLMSDGNVVADLFPGWSRLLNTRGGVDDRNDNRRDVVRMGND